MLAVERKGDVQIVRVQEQKLTYPALSSFFAEVRQLVESGARKVVVDEVGVETEMPMDDWVEVGVFGEGEPYLQKHRIHTGPQKLTVIVPVRRQIRQWAAA